MFDAWYTPRLPQAADPSIVRTCLCRATSRPRTGALSPVQIPNRPDAHGEGEEADEAGGVGLFVDFFLAEGGEAFIVEGVGGAAADGGGRFLEEAGVDLAGEGFGAAVQADLRWMPFWLWEIGVIETTSRRSMVSIRPS